MAHFCYAAGIMINEISQALSKTQGFFMTVTEVAKGVFLLATAGTDTDRDSNAWQYENKMGA